MKKFVLVLISVLSISAHASDSFKLDDDSIALLPVEGEVTDLQVDSYVFPDCPPFAMCMPMSRATIKLNFNLNGCMDELGTVTYMTEFNEDMTKATVYVSAIQVASKKSLVAFCTALPTAQRELVITGRPGLEEVEVKFLTETHGIN